MSLDSLITVFAIAVAVYAAAPQQTKYSFELRRWIWVATTAIATILLIYFHFFRVIKLPCPTIFPNKACSLLTLDVSENPIWVTPKEAAFFVIILWLMGAVYLIANKKLCRSQISAACKIISTSIRNNKFESAYDFIKVNFELIEKESKRESKQSYDSASLLSSIASNRDFIAFLCKADVRFATKLLKCDNFRFREYIDNFLYTQLTDKSSALNEEVTRYQDNLFDYQKGSLKRQDLITYQLFHDISYTEKSGTFKPMGDLFCALLADYPDNKSRIEWYNSPSYGSSEHKELGGELVAIICLFDLMVSRAAWKEIEYHMWLHYFPIFIDRVLFVYDERTARLNDQEEYPIKFSYLIRETIEVQARWIKLGTVLPQENYHVRTGPSSSTGSIPFSACRSISLSMRKIIESSKLSSRQKNQNFEILADLFTNNSTQIPESPLRSHLVSELCDASNKADYFDSLLRLIDCYDPYYKPRLNDLREQLKQRSSTAPP